MISQDVVVVRDDRGDGRGRSASMKGHAAVPKAVDEILIERRTGLTVDVADGAEGGRGRARKWRSVYGKRRFELLLLLHPSRLKAVAPSDNRGDTTKRNSKFLWIPTAVDRYVTLCKSPRLVYLNWLQIAKSI